jgi:hypothetical protein
MHAGWFLRQRHGVKIHDLPFLSLFHDQQTERKLLTTALPLPFLDLLSSFITHATTRLLAMTSLIPAFPI